MINSNRDPKAIHKDASAEISTITEKTTPVSADLLIIEDSAASNAKKRVQIGNLPSGGGSDPWTHYVLTSTFTVSNTTQTLVTDGSTSWSHSVEANKWYEIVIVIFVQDGDGASDNRMEITKPASSDGYWYAATVENAVVQTKQFSASGTLFISYGGNDDIYNLGGMLKTTASGTVTLTWANDVGTTDNVMGVGSYMKIREVTPE